MMARSVTLPNGNAHWIVHILYAELIKNQKSEEGALRALSDKAGIEYQTLRAWRYNKFSTLVKLEKALEALGYKLAVVPNDEQVSADHE